VVLGKQENRMARVVDINHPLAGQDVLFQITLEEIVTL
jgi:FKBP-type peptidyl-prolyl cis-trans isomerase 2